MRTTREDALELILHLTVTISGLIYFAAISKISYITLKFAKKTTTTTTTLSSKINTTFYFGKQEEAHKSFRREWIPRTARVVANTFTMYRIACVARFLKVPANFPA